MRALPQSLAIAYFRPRSRFHFNAFTLFNKYAHLLSKQKVVTTPKLLLNAKPNPATNSQLTKLNQGEPLDLKQIKLIVDLMKRSDLTEFEVEEEGFKIKIKRNSAEGATAPQAAFSAHPFPPGVTIEQPRAAAPALTLPSASPASNTAAGDEAGYTYVKSPMVGTFYRSPSPDSPAFVDVNSKVDEKSVVCIIEAMKIMNEIQAEVKGTVVEVLVENGQPVEYGQRLYKVKVA